MTTGEPTIAVEAERPLLEVAAEAEAAGQYLPVDAAVEATTAAEAAAGTRLGPRALGYGPARRWVVGARTRDGHELGPPEADAGAWAGLAADALETITWRTLAQPEATRTVIGLFLESAGAARALATLAAEPPPSLVAAELCDRGAGHWLVGEVLDAECVLVLRLEGETEAAARAGRAAWQAVERAGGMPRVFEREWGRWRWRATHPTLGARAVVARFEAPNAELPALFDAVRETGALLGESAARAHALLGALYGYLPTGPRLDEALTWLRSAARERDAALEVVLPGMA